MVKVDLKELDEARDAQDVEHGERAEKQPAEQQEHALASRVKALFAQLGQILVAMLYRGQRLGVHDRRVAIARAERAPIA